MKVGDNIKEIREVEKNFKRSYMAQKLEISTKAYSNIENNIFIKIGDNIREISEKEKGVKKEEISKALGITIKAYSNIESNITDITLSRLFEIADFLGTTPDYILNHKEKETFNNHFNNYE